MTSNSAKKCVTSRDGDICLENKTSQDTRCIIFSTYFLSKKHIMESMCPNILSSWIHRYIKYTVFQVVRNQYNSIPYNRILDKPVNFSADHRFPSLLRDPLLHYCVHNTPALDPDPAESSPYTLILDLSLRLVLPNSSGFLQKFWAQIPSLKHVTCPGHVILDLILLMHGKQHNLWRSSFRQLCSVYRLLIPA